MAMETTLHFTFIKIYIYYSNRFVVSWRETDSYFNNEPIQIGDIEIITSAYGSSGSFVSRVRSKYIGHNKYTGRISNLCLKNTNSCTSSQI